MYSTVITHDDRLIRIVICLLYKPLVMQNLTVIIVGKTISVKFDYVFNFKQQYC
jgi:hypothetical protein